MKKRLFLLFVFTTLFSGISKAQLAGSGKAYDFSSSYISIPNAPILSPTSAITVEAWIKADSYAGNSWENVIVSKDGWGSGNQGYTLRTGANGVLSFNFASNGVWKEVTSSAVMSTGNWYHVAGTYDGTNIRIYINGIEQNSLAFAGPISNGAYDVTIGKMSYLAGGTRYFDGMIDEVKIWSSALPESSLREYMCKKVTSSHPQYASLAGYWNMDQTGAITDQSSNGNNGTSIGATQVNSGAAIGDASVYSYLSTPNLTLPYGSIDTAKVNASSILPLVHLYRVDAAPLVSAIGTLDSIDQTHYYGVYVTPTPVANYNFTYHYGSNPLSTGNENYLIIGNRVMGSSSPWLATSTTQNQTLNTMSYAVSGRKEMILALDCPSVNITPSNSQNLCAGQNVVLTVPSGATNIQWYDGATPISGATSNTLTVSTTGSYYVSANTGICATTGPSVSVTVHPIPTVDFGDLPSNTFCVTDGLQNITNYVPASGGIFSGPGIFNNTFTPNMAPAGTHTLYYNFTDQYGCHNVDSLIVTLGTPPPTPVITVSNGTTLCVPSCGTFTWTLNGTTITGATDSCIIATSNGTYTVTCLTPEGCSATSANFVLSGVGLNETTWANNIEIAPNPTTSSVNIILLNPSSQNLTYKITDINGRLMQEKELLTKNNNIDFSQWEGGIYLIILSNGQEQIIKRIIKE
jgi:hypothetical protein